MISTILVLLVLGATAEAAERVPNFDVTDDELRQIVNQLRSEDDNKAKPGQVVLNYQGHTSTRDETDNASGKFFTKVDASLLRKPTYEKFIAMSNNWNRQTGIKEPSVSLNEEKSEVGKFLDTVFQTRLWKSLYQFLNKKGHPFAKDPNTWRYWIAQLWFVHYSRARGVADTSGFEHVFMGEAKNGEISGMHNWIRFHLLESNVTEKFDYKGFIVKRFTECTCLKDDNGSKIHNLVAAVKFSWFDELKRSGSFLIGTSPEFDLALYTVCFLSRRGRQTCDIDIDGCPLAITSYDLLQNNKVFIGSVFPGAGRITEQCRRQNG